MHLVNLYALRENYGVLDVILYGELPSYMHFVRICILQLGNIIVERDVGGMTSLDRCVGEIRLLEFRIAKVPLKMIGILPLRRSLPLLLLYALTVCAPEIAWWPPLQMHEALSFSIFPVFVTCLKLLHQTPSPSLARKSSPLVEILLFM